MLFTVQLRNPDHRFCRNDHVPASLRGSTRMLVIINVRNDNLGIISVMNKPPYGTTPQGFSADRIKIPPLRRRPQGVHPLNYDDPRLNPGHSSLERRQTDGAASFFVRLHTCFLLRSELPSTRFWLAVSNSGHDRRARLLLLFFDLVLHNLAYLSFRDASYPSPQQTSSFFRSNRRSLCSITPWHS